MCAVICDEIFQGPLQPKKFGSSFFLEDKKNQKRTHKIRGIVTLVTHLLVKVIDRRMEK